jgi:hypothetical protein
MEMGGFWSALQGLQDPPLPSYFEETNIYKNAKQNMPTPFSFGVYNS